MPEPPIAGRYRLDRQVGAGGMSEVWAGSDLELDRAVAVKLLAPDADPARFDREARAAAGLAHANVCAVYDYGESEGRRFIVLEYLPGGSLEDQLTQGQPLPDSATRRISAEIASGLAHAHARGVVHRDLKPSNVLFDAEGRAKIADFGIARTAGGTGLTEAGTVLGTAAYISPEQAAGRPATPASDIYAFGVILFRMLTGRLPFESPDAFALAAMHRDLAAPPVSELRSDAPPLFESVAAAALAKSPSDRPQDGAVLAAELAGVTELAAESEAATQVIVPPRTRRTGLLVGLAIAVLAAAGVGLAMAVTLTGGTPTGPVSTPPTTRPAAPPPSAPVEHETTALTTAAPTTSSAPTTTTRPATSASVTTLPATVPASTTAPTTSATTTAPTSSTLPTTSTTEPVTTIATTTGTLPATTVDTSSTATTATTVPG